MLPTEDDKRCFDQVAYTYLKEYDRIVDIGCGEGRFISIDPSRIIGVEKNPESIKVCKQKNYRVLESDVRSLPFEDGSVPAVHCSHVIEHFMPEDVHKILSEIDRVLEPGGIFIIRTPLLYKGFYSDLTHIRPYNPQSIVGYFFGSHQKTMSIINPEYKQVKLEWRYDPISIKNKLVNKIINGFIKKRCPWLRRNGYLLVMKKNR